MVSWFPELYYEKVLPTTDFVTVLLVTEQPKQMETVRYPFTPVEMAGGAGDDRQGREQGRSAKG